MIYWETFQVEELSNKHVTELLGICALVIGVEYFTKKQAEPERLCYLVQEIVLLKSIELVYCTKWPKIVPDQLKSLTSEAIPSATQFFMRAYNISHFPGL